MNSDNPQTLHSGTHVDAFRIDDVIGSGGFGVTYRGHDLKLDQPVAIKEYFPGHLAVRSRNDTTLAPRTRGDTEAYGYGLERFLREARTLAQFRSPNIVRVNHYVEGNNTAYLVMDLEEGQPLSVLLERIGRINDRQGVALAIHLLRGLVAVHSRDCLHRDIKPANIFVRRSGPPLLLDFGAARFALEQRTGTLTVMYTPGYAPVEQYGGNEIQGPWSDLYALGATLYHCLTGSPPFASVERVSALHAGRPDPLQAGFAQIRAGVRPALAEAIERMLRPRAAERPPTAAAVLDVLQPSAGRETQDAGPTVIRMPSEREAAARRDSLSPSSRSGGPSAAPAPVSATVVPAIADAELDAIGQLLVHHLGPIANVLVRRAAVRCESKEALVRSLADECDEPRERDAFLAAALRLV